MPCAAFPETTVITADGGEAEAEKILINVAKIQRKGVYLLQQTWQNAATNDWHARSAPRFWGVTVASEK